MTERTPPPVPPGSADIPGSAPSEPAADFLQVTPEPWVDDLIGEGVRYRLGSSPSTEIDVFPTQQTVRIIGDAFSLRLFHQDPPTLSPEGMQFDQVTQGARRQVFVSPEGMVSLDYDPNPERPRMPQDAALPVRQRMSRSPVDDIPGDDSGVTDTASETLSQNTEIQSDKERMHLAGRLGTEVRFRTTRNNKTVASFALAIKHDDGSTQWHDVLVFNERAEKLRAGQTPQKGQFCEVVGYRHEREVKGKGGTKRTIEEIYAVVVKPR